jgi:hypothetical protein
MIKLSNLIEANDNKYHYKYDKAKKQYIVYRNDNVITQFSKEEDAKNHVEKINKISNHWYYYYHIITGIQTKTVSSIDNIQKYNYPILSIFW